MSDGVMVWVYVRDRPQGLDHLMQVSTKVDEIKPPGEATVLPNHYYAIQLIIPISLECKRHQPLANASTSACAPISRHLYARVRRVAKAKAENSAALGIQVPPPQVFPL